MGVLLGGILPSAAAAKVDIDGNDSSRGCTNRIGAPCRWYCVGLAAESLALFEWKSSFRRIITLTLSSCER